MRAFMLRVAGALLICASARAEVLPLDAGQNASLQSWLNAHREYRTALDADCDCAEDLGEIRTTSEGVWKANPGYRPYFVKGDFRKNGKTDFAVIVVKRDRSKPLEGMLLIFDGPFATVAKTPAYVKKVTPIKGMGLVVPPGSSWPVYGPYASEGCYYKPESHTYREVCETNY